MLCVYSCVLGGEAGERGLNLLERTDGRLINLGGKASIEAYPGVSIPNLDVITKIRIKTFSKPHNIILCKCMYSYHDIVIVQIILLTKTSIDFILYVWEKLKCLLTY